VIYYDAVRSLNKIEKLLKKFGSFRTKEIYKVYNLVYDKASIRIRGASPQVRDFLNSQLKDVNKRDDYNSDEDIGWNDKPYVYLGDNEFPCVSIGLSKTIRDCPKFAAALIRTIILANEGKTTLGDFKMPIPKKLQSLTKTVT